MTWRDKLRVCLVEKFGQDEGLSLFREYGDVFPLARGDSVICTLESTATPENAFSSIRSTSLRTAVVYFSRGI